MHVNNVRAVFTISVGLTRAVVAFGDNERTVVKLSERISVTVYTSASKKSMAFYRLSGLTDLQLLLLHAYGFEVLDVILYPKKRFMCRIRAPIHRPFHWQRHSPSCCHPRWEKYGNHKM